MTMLSKFQKDLLNLLLDQYEKSKTYRGENKVAQTFSAEPSRIYPGYDSDYTDVEQIRDFESQMEELERLDLIVISRSGGQITKLTANPRRWDEDYQLLGREDKETGRRRQTELYRRYMGQSPLLDRFCREQIGRLEAGKKARYKEEEGEAILKLCSFILGNQRDILERELSVAVLGDSKVWETRYRTKVCRLLREYGDFDRLLLGLSDREDQEDRRESERILLAEFHIYPNPSYVYWKGNAEIAFDNGETLRVTPRMPLAFSAETLKHVKSLRVLDARVMTIENLTSFNRMEEEDTFMIFLSGYHNSVKQRLIRGVCDANPGLEWVHFGDIDPDGFYIIENLRRGTGIDFQPVYMDVDTLKQYHAYTKPLTERDVRKARALAESGRYQDVMEELLRGRRKLEQEIVSWMNYE